MTITINFQSIKPAELGYPTLTGAERKEVALICQDLASYCNAMVGRNKNPEIAKTANIESAENTLSSTKNVGDLELADMIEEKAYKLVDMGLSDIEDSIRLRRKNGKTATGFYAMVSGLLHEIKWLEDNYKFNSVTSLLEEEKEAEENDFYEEYLNGHIDEKQPAGGAIETEENDCIECGSDIEVEGGKCFDCREEETAGETEEEDLDVEEENPYLECEQCGAEDQTVQEYNDGIIDFNLCAECKENNDKEKKELELEPSCNNCYSKGIDKKADKRVDSAGDVWLCFECENLLYPRIIKCDKCEKVTRKETTKGEGFRGFRLANDGAERGIEHFYVDISKNSDNPLYTQIIHIDYYCAECFCSKFGFKINEYGYYTEIFKPKNLLIQEIRFTLPFPYNMDIDYVKIKSNISIKEFIECFGYKDFIELKDNNCFTFYVSGRYKSREIEITLDTTGKTPLYMEYVNRGKDEPRDYRLFDHISTKEKLEAIERYADLNNEEVKNAIKEIVQKTKDSRGLK